MQRKFKLKVSYTFHGYFTLVRLSGPYPIIIKNAFE
jgi:hypothetical protein